jgi:hypothetical protein
VNSLCLVRHRTQLQSATTAPPELYDNETLRSDWPDPYIGELVGLGLRKNEEELRVEGLLGSAVPASQPASQH